MNTKEYKKAVWEFMLEHSDITPNGSIFIKFHCDDRANFEKRVLARHNGYHRNDIAEKEKIMTEKKIQHIKNKNLKKSKYRKAKKVRKIKSKIIKTIKNIWN